MSDDCKSNVLPEPKNVEEIIQRYLLLYGYDGIWNPDVPCGCLSTHLAPCEGDCLGCLPGYRTDYKPEDECGCDREGDAHWHIGPRKGGEDETT